MKKLSLSFYTNIPTPNQDDFFDELSRLFHFNVIFYEKTESDRNWVLSKILVGVFLNALLMKRVNL